MNESLISLIRDSNIPNNRKAEIEAILSMKFGGGDVSYVVRVPSINAPEKTVTMLDPENDLSELIGAYLGNDAKRIFENILDAKSREYDEIDDAHYELIADGYRRELVDTMNALREALDDPKLNRKKIFNIYKNLYNNL